MMEPGRGGARQPPWKNPRDLDQPVPSLCHPQQRARESSPGGPLFLILARLNSTVPGIVAI